uniref:C2H2-type domain-containing protein n=1 Tax=viral metagenome TaxID=1070528 RepID=A0A6C0DSS7_9ZZZZ
MNSLDMINCCKSCSYYTAVKKDFNKHLTTRKHILNSSKTVKPNMQSVPDNATALVRASPTTLASENRLECDNCGKFYKDKSGLWRHNKKCNAPKRGIDNDMINKLIEQNQELQKQVLELAKQGTVINTNTTTNTNSNNTTNNQFNMNFFLNEKCKDAINLSEFMHSIQLQLEDLENTARLGYVEGISRILIRALNDMDIDKRPIHCTDVKRETIYVKEQDNWEREQPDKNNLKRAVNYIADQNLCQIDRWKQENPSCLDTNSEESQQLSKIYINALGGSCPDEDRKFMDKIIKNVLHEVVVDKTS